MNGASIEVRCFQGLVARGVMTVKAARELIGVNVAEEAELRKFLDLAVVERLLADRREILYQFNRAIAKIERPRDKKRRRLSRNVRRCLLQAAKASSVSCSL
jgi:hypothetical protein